MRVFEPVLDYVPQVPLCPNGFIAITPVIWLGYRAGGGCICEICGREYYDHKQEKSEEYFFYNVICNGDRVKL